MGSAACHFINGNYVIIRIHQYRQENVKKKKVEREKTIRNPKN